jgi:hypothetical protein
MRDEFSLSASDNLIAPSVWILLTVLCEKGNEEQVLHLRLSQVRDVFDMSASDNLEAPSLPIPFPVLSEKKELLSSRITSNVERCKRRV